MKFGASNTHYNCRRDSLPSSFSFLNISGFTTLFQSPDECWKTEQTPSVFFPSVPTHSPQAFVLLLHLQETEGLLFMFRCSSKHQIKNNLRADNVSHFAFTERLKLLNNKFSITICDFFLKEQYLRLLLAHKLCRRKHLFSSLICTLSYTSLFIISFHVLSCLVVLLTSQFDRLWTFATEFGCLSIYECPSSMFKMQVVYPVSSSSIRFYANITLRCGLLISNSCVITLKFYNIFHNYYLWEVLLSLNNTMKWSLFPAFYAELFTA